MHAPCAGLTELFFSEEVAEQERAKAICRRCPRAPLCRLEAMVTGATDGVWGGFTADELWEHVRDGAPHPSRGDNAADGGGP